MGVTFTCTLDEASCKNIYTCGDILSGEIDLRVMQQINIEKIFVRLTAVSVTTYTVTSNQQRRTYRESHELLNITNEVFPSGELRASSHTFMDRSSHKFRFLLQIPLTCNVANFSGQPLPPTLPKLRSHPATARITYIFEAKLVTPSFFSFNKSRTTIITFCPNHVRDLHALGTKIFKAEKQTFEHKIQKFIDSDQGAIENPIECGHKHTRFIRGIFNDNYKSQNYKNLVQDVRLETSLETSGFLSPGYTFGFFQAKIFSPIKSLEPHYLLKDGTSSSLGKFTISSVEIDLLERTKISAKRHTKTIHRTIGLGKFTSMHKSFDIVNFDKQEYGYSKLFNLLDGKQVVIPPDILPDFDCGNGQISRYYKLQIEIRLNSDGKSLKFKYKTDINIMDMRFWPQIDWNVSPGIVGHQVPMYSVADWMQPPAPEYRELRDQDGYISD